MQCLLFAHCFMLTLDLSSPRSPAFTATSAFILLQFCFSIGSDLPAHILSSTNCSKVLLCLWHSCIPVLPRTYSSKNFLFCHFVGIKAEIKVDVWAQSIVIIQYQKLWTQTSIIFLYKFIGKYWSSNDSIWAQGYTDCSSVFFLPWAMFYIPYAANSLLYHLKYMLTSKQMSSLNKGVKLEYSSRWTAGQPGIGSSRVQIRLQPIAHLSRFSGSIFLKQSSGLTATPQAALVSSSECEESKWQSHRGPYPWLWPCRGSKADSPRLRGSGLWRSLTGKVRSLSPPFLWWPEHDTGPLQASCPSAVRWPSSGVHFMEPLWRLYARCSELWPRSLPVLVTSLTVQTKA